MNRYETYKDSGIPWLGEIPEHWNICRLKDEVTFNDEVLGDKTDTDYEILYVDISNVSLIEGIIQKELMTFEHSPSRARRIVKNGDVIVSTVRTYLKAITQIQDAEDNLIVSTGFAVLRPKADLFPRFLGYWVQSENMIGAIVSNSVGVSYPAINATDLVRLPIVKLPKKEQTAIAHYLDTKLGEIDALIGKQQTLLEKLAEQRTAVITHAVTKGLNPAAPMKNSGVEWLGDVPAHWSIIQFRRVVENIKDGTHGTHSRENNGFPLLSAKNVFNDGIHIHDNESQISEEDYKLITSNGFPKKNDLLITCVGSIGRCCIYPFDTPFAFQRSVAFLRLNKNAVPQFYKYFVESNCYQEQLKANVKLSIQGGVYLGTLISMYAILPTKEEQTSIAGYLNQETAKIDRLCETVNQTIGRLKEYRTALITQAVTGKIKVTDE